jgi:hypothetical protein
MQASLDILATYLVQVLVETRPLHVSISRPHIQPITMPTSCVADLSWRDKIIFGPGHQSPEKAPPVPIANMEHVLPMINNSMSLIPRDLVNPLLKRDALRCDDGPCPDDRFVVSIWHSPLQSD